MKTKSILYRFYSFIFLLFIYLFMFLMFSTFQFADIPRHGTLVICERNSYKKSCCKIKMKMREKCKRKDENLQKTRKEKKLSARFCFVFYIVNLAIVVQSCRFMRKL